jgi:PKHD-type hydroxylase
VARLQAISQQMKFVDGKATNSLHIAKQNLQAPRDPSDALYTESVRIASAAYMRSREFGDFTVAKQLSAPLLSRYDLGMKYGMHADSAHFPIPPNILLRTDLSSTVFLNDPDSYDGGELVLQMGDQSKSIKLAAGDAIVYPSTWLHEVTEVTRGSRLVLVTFIESMIRDQHQRTQYTELKRVFDREKDAISWDSQMSFNVVIQNLMRMWSAA